MVLTPRQGARVRPLAMRKLGCLGRHKQKMQPKLQGTIIWRKQKMHLNCGIVPAQVMNSSQDSNVILPIMRTADKS